jgi:NitT/TauT family transport system substrate-binding protein
VARNHPFRPVERDRAAGCSSKGDSNGSGAALTPVVPKPEQPEITVAAIPAVDLAGLYIAQDRGLFARQGLHVTIVPVPSAQSVITGQLAGKIDISAGSYVAYLAAQATGARFRILAEASTLSPGTRALVVTSGSRIATVGQLAGCGSSPTRTGSPAMPGTLQHGAWSAAFLAEPYITAAGQQYGQLVLADLDQGAVLNLPVDGYVATQAWARARPGTAAAGRPGHGPDRDTGTGRSHGSRAAGPGLVDDQPRFLTHAEGAGMERPRLHVSGRRHPG